MNKFIFSGLIQTVNETENSIGFTIPTFNTGYILMTMTFDQKIIENVAKLLENGNVIITVEGFVAPGNKGQLDLVTTSITTSAVPNKEIVQA